jgi:general secretion pathway protein A
LPSPPSSKADTQQAPESTHQEDFRESRLVIPFASNTNELAPEVLARLDELARYMLRRTEPQIVVRGYTDALGGNEYNRNLSTFRANVVKSYLTGKGISPNRIRVIGMGDAAPRMPNTTSTGRAANRRVEIEFVPHKP